MLGMQRRRGRRQLAVADRNRVVGNYSLQNYLGGKDPRIFEAKSIKGEIVVVKLEKNNSNNTPNNNCKNKLSSETDTLKRLKDCKCVAQMLWSGTDLTDTVLVVPLLGFSFEDLSLEGRFSNLSCCKAAAACLNCLKEIHSQGFIHCSLSPKTFHLQNNNLLGTDQWHLTPLKMVNFRLARYFLRSKNAHRTYNDGGKITGVPRYASVTSHRGVRLARRDDLESLVYVLLFMFFGRLPWQGLQGTRDEKRNQAMELKAATLPKDLIKYGADSAPEEIIKLLTHARALAFDSQPNYDVLIELFEKAANSGKYGYVQDYDHWIINQDDQI